MALTARGKALLLLSLAVGLLAAFWPSLNIHQHLPTSLQTVLKDAGCPLGYTSGPLPDNHPPVAGQRDTVVPGVRVLVLAIYHNGTIWTADSKLPVADAMLVDEEQGSVLRMGSLEELLAEAERIQKETVRRSVEIALRDLRGTFLMPGLIDPHVHFITGGLMLSHVDLGQASSKQQVVETLRAAGARRAHQAEPGWVLGGGWNEQRWGGELPHKSWLDEALGDVPALLTRTDLHCGVASSEALRLAGIGPDTPDPPGGSIERGEDGQPTGVLRDMAMEIVGRLSSQPTLQQRLDALTAAAQHALSKGITTVGDMGRLWSDSSRWDDFTEVYQPLADNWTLPLRIHPYMPLKSWSRLAALVGADGYVHPSGRLCWGGVKEFADGSLGSCTALMHRPYAACADGQEAGSQGTGGQVAGEDSDGGCDGDDGRCGIRLVELDVLEQQVLAADKAGLQVAVHAIGDRAVDDVAAIFRRAGKARKQRDREDKKRFRPQGMPDTRPASRPFRLEHAQHLSSPAAAKKLSHSKIMVVPNPLHLLDDAGIALSRLGPERASAGHAFALHTLTQNAVALAFSSDWPVAPLEPLVALHAAAYRRPPGQAACCGTGPGGSTPSTCLYQSETGKGEAARAEQAEAGAGTSIWPWLPEEAVDAAAALLAHTREAAKALMMQDYVGSLSEGMRADFVVLEHSPLQGPWSCHSPRVLTTFLDGKCAYGCAGAPWVA